MSFSAKPVKCSSIRPHLIYSDEVLFAELQPTIVALFHTVCGNSPKYDLHDAISDAWIGYTKAKEHDNKPPSIAGQKIECPECHHINQMPEVMESDSTTEVSCDRTFDLECESCHHKWQKTIIKSQFSTCVYPFIRGEIQRGARESRRCGIVNIKKQETSSGARVDPSIVSVDVFSHTSDHVCDAISIEHNLGETNISFEMKKRIKAALNKLPDRQNEVISRMFGFEFGGEVMEPMTQAQVADVIGITRQRICAIVSCAMIHLKKELEKYNET
jgi:RNA polymerase sigma factor (sigma-70 family)